MCGLGSLPPGGLRVPSQGPTDSSGRGGETAGEARTDIGSSRISGEQQQRAGLKSGTSPLFCTRATTKGLRLPKTQERLLSQGMFSFSLVFSALTCLGQQAAWSPRHCHNEQQQAAQSRRPAATAAACALSPGTIPASRDREQRIRAAECQWRENQTMGAKHSFLHLQTARARYVSFVIIMHCLRRYRHCCHVCTSKVCYTYVRFFITENGAPANTEVLQQGYVFLARRHIAGRVCMYVVRCTHVVPGTVLVLSLV